MITVSPWKTFLIIAVCAFAFLYSAPNFVDQQTLERVRSSLPSWVPNKTVNLGLDLRGGAHLLYEVDVDVVFKERADLMLQDLRAELREEKMGYASVGTVPMGVRARLKGADDGENVRKVLRGIDPNLDVKTAADGMSVEAYLNEAGQKQIVDQTLSQSIEIVRRRIDELGTTEPIIQRQGWNRILIQAPGANAEELKNIIGTTAKLTFHLLQEGEGGKMLPMTDEPGRRVPIQRRPMLTGDMLTDAQPSFGQDGQPVVSFRLNSLGARKFCDVTRNNVGKPFAIVLDDQVVSDPNINEEICGGNAQISGSFTLKEATDLALLLRAGALPAPMHVVEERTVGPTLGSDSVKAGSKACIMALLFVMTMACMVYGLFGVFASFSLFVNVSLILAIMSLLQATLTLPGIAGIVLTIGLAIDANVLVFERMKEELRAGRSVISALDTGYQRALTTITDSNLTSLIAALILFSFGTGPIKGFAVTMCIGVVTSYFCALGLTRLIIVTWLRWKKPKTIAA